MSLDPATQALASIIDSTIAAERLEGWQPTPEHVEALTALGRGDIDFGDYLAPFRARHPQAQRHRRRPGLRRAAPYYLPGTTLLRNNFGAVSADVLADLEYVATAGRMVQWLGRPAERPRRATLDVRTMHRHLFADVYRWAGDYRTTELRRGRQGFAWQSTIAERMTGVHQAARSILAACNDSRVGWDDPRLAFELARLYADFNQIHPFREGNGRTGALLLQTIVATSGRRLDLTDVTRDEWYGAAIDSMPFRRDGRASHRPFLYLLGPALRAQ